jgi:hypothetical protein
MSRKHFSLLLVVTLAVAVLVLLTPGRTGRESSMDKSRLLPGLQEQVNNLNWLRITGAGDQTIATLHRDVEHWRVQEVFDYPADWAKLRTLLADLARAEVIEQKTDNPQYYDRLGVEDVSRPEATGVRIEFDSASGVPAVIIGNRAQAGQGQYARLQDAAGSVLLDRVLEVPKDRINWLDKDIVNISDSEVVEVDIRHPDGERVVARKASADDENFVLQDIPKGRSIRSEWTVNSLANALSSLTLEDVAPDASFDWSAAVQFGVVTADGLRVDVELISKEPEAVTEATTEEPSGKAAEGEAAPAKSAQEAQDWARLTAGLYQTAVESATETSKEAETATDRAAALNLRLSGWAYRLPAYKADAMRKRMEDLLLAETKPKE